MMGYAHTAYLSGIEAASYAVDYFKAGFVLTLSLILLGMISMLSFVF
jgi:cytochrome c oxidase subunit IV